MVISMNSLRISDPEIATCIAEELKRQQDGIELIASENVVSFAVLEAVGSILTNKYAEGYPGKRYYGGCEVVDEVERIAIERAKLLFGADHANVQPHSGASANMAAYMALTNAGDTILGMRLDHGGHLTHGAKVNASGRLYNFVSYAVRKEDGLIDYDEVEAMAMQHKPKLIVAGASAYPRVIDFARFKDIADKNGALLMVDMAHIAGLVAAKIHPSPMPFADVVTTTTHKTLRGPRGGLIFCKEAFKKQIDSAVFPGLQGGPLMHVIAGKAVCLKEAMRPEFVSYQKQVVENAQSLAAELSRRSYRLLTGGTDNHMMLVDLTSQGVTGQYAEKTLEKVGIVANKNKVPFDEAPAQVTSGIRFGTPAVTSRGMATAEMAQIARLIDEAIRAKEDEAKLHAVKAEVLSLCSRFPMYQ
jgi:glycine hydroxymethyltransferase